MKNDSNPNIDMLKSEMKDFIRERDWEKFHSPKNLAMSIAIESAELMEHFQWMSSDEALKIIENPETLCEVRDELSDILAYCLSLANYLEIDVTSSFLSKLEKNRRKYPSDRVYGKSTKYNRIDCDDQETMK